MEGPKVVWVMCMSVFGVVYADHYENHFSNNWRHTQEDDPVIHLEQFHKGAVVCTKDKCIQKPRQPSKLLDIWHKTREPKVNTNGIDIFGMTSTDLPKPTTTNATARIEFDNPTMEPSHNDSVKTHNRNHKKAKGNLDLMHYPKRGTTRVVAHRGCGRNGCGRAATIVEYKTTLTALPKSTTTTTAPIDSEKSWFLETYWETTDDEPELSWRKSVIIPIIAEPKSKRPKGRDTIMKQEEVIAQLWDTLTYKK